MNQEAKQGFIRRKARENKLDADEAQILWSRHSAMKLVTRALIRREVEDALVLGEVIEDYPPTNRPLPDCLVLAWDPSGQPVHCVIAVDEVKDRILVITVYRPSSEEWKNDWKTRK